MKAQDLNPVTQMLHHPEITMELQLDNTRHRQIKQNMSQNTHTHTHTHNATVVAWLFHSVSLSQEL
jgi:hypothetical protein